MRRQSPSKAAHRRELLEHDREKGVSPATPPCIAVATRILNCDKALGAYLLPHGDCIDSITEMISVVL